MDIGDCFFDTQDYIQINKNLGEGSFGKVYVIKSKDSENLYAAKSIKPQCIFTNYQQTLFLRESLNLSKINHPAIVQFYGINLHSFEDPSILEPTILIEYYPKGSLKEILDNEKLSNADDNWSPTKKYICLLGITDAMRYLHKIGIIHRDLKPQNILIDADYYPHVGDFGLSRCFSQALTNSIQLSLTRNVGSPLYMAPEILEGEDHYGPGVDVYAFAFLAYEIMVGKEPFAEDGKIANINKVISKIFKGQRPEFPIPISEKMKSLITQCWSQDPKDRPSFDSIFEKLSTDFSYSDETVDQDEINEYLEILKESRIEAMNEELKNPDKKKIQIIEEELDKLKEENRKCIEDKNLLQQELAKLKEENRKCIEEKNLFQQELVKLGISLTIDNSPRTLHIKICEARKITKQSLFGKPNPSVTLHLKSQNDKKIVSTKVVSNSLDPVWNEDFYIDSDVNNDKLIINMYSNDSKGTQKLMDEIEFPLSEWPIRGQIDRKEVEIKLNTKMAGTLIFEAQSFPIYPSDNQWKSKIGEKKLKLFLVGELGTGKSTLEYLFAQKVFKKYIQDLGVNFHSCSINIDGVDVNMQIFDRSGQERFHLVSIPYYKDTDGFMIVCDVFDKSSFDRIGNWLKIIKEQNLDHVPMIIVGNKKEIRSHYLKKVSYEEASQIASEYSLQYFEVSAKENTGVDEAFYCLIKKVLQTL